MSTDDGRPPGYGDIPTNPTITITSPAPTTPINLPSLPYPSMSSSSPGDSPCGTDKICDCIGESINSIAASQRLIAQTLYDRLGKVCDQIDGCIDQISSKLKAKWERGVKTCDECKSMVRNGMSGTIEFALACAGSCIGEATQQCSPGHTRADGITCSGCGQAPCCCDLGQCVPCDEPEQPKRKYQGWCDPITKLTVVTREGDPSPGPTYIPGPLTDTEEVAFEQAATYCRSDTQPPIQGTPPRFPTPQPSSQFCSIADYANGNAQSKIGSGVGLANNLAGAYDFQNALGSIGVAGISPSSIGNILVGLFRSQASTPALITSDFSDLLAKMSGCDSPGYRNAIASLASFSNLQKTLGANFDEFLEPIRYAMRSMCTYRMLSPDQAMAGYLANSVTDSELATYWAIGGYCPNELRAAKYASKSKPVPQQLGMMRLRELISPSEYLNGMREVGYTDQHVVDKLFQLHQQPPTMTDIIRFMVRDADDPSIEFWPESDRLFEQKYQATLKKWAKWQGVPDEVAKYAWRAHWTIPAPTQLFEFWHRLRKNPQFGGEAKVLERIKSAMVQQDILPFWHDYYLAVSFRPMGRVDIRRAFNIGSVTEQELPGLFGQIGYSDDVADKLTKFSVKLRDQSAIGHRAVKLYNKFLMTRAESVAAMQQDGLPEEVANRALSMSEGAFISSPYSAAFIRGDLSKDDLLAKLTAHGVTANNADRIAVLLALRKTSHWAVHSYITGSIDTGEATQVMTNDGLEPAIISHLIEKANRTVDDGFIAQCQRGIKRRYLLGDLTADESRTELVARGTTTERAAKMVGWWDCEKLSNGKQVFAAKLCKWLSDGIINAAEFIKRLGRIGYSGETANLMLSDCLGSISAKRLAQAQKDAKSQEMEARKAAQIATRTAAGEQRRLNALQTARSKAAKVRQGRDKQLYAAAENMMKKGGMSFADSIAFVKEGLQELNATYGLPVDESLQVLVVATENWDGEDTATLGASMNELANTINNPSLAPPLEDVYVPPISSGAIQPSAPTRPL